MPNWCNNTVTISGPEDSIAAFIKAARGRMANYNNAYFDGEAWPVHDEIRMKAAVKDPAPLDDEECSFCFNALYPVPEDFRRFPFDNGRANKLGEHVGEERAIGGYGWQSNNWGTKWDVGPGAEFSVIENQYVEIEFMTAWSPPVSFFDKVCKDYPNLQFELTYYEGGMGYAGRSTFAQGELIEEIDLPIEDFYNEEEYE